jgi:hypothetical protein
MICLGALPFVPLVVGIVAFAAMRAEGARSIRPSSKANRVTRALDRYNRERGRYDCSNW